MGKSAGSNSGGGGGGGGQGKSTGGGGTPATENTPTQDNVKRTLELPGGKTATLKPPYSVGENLVVDKKVGDRLADNLKPGDELVYAYRDGQTKRQKITDIYETKNSWGKPTGEREFRLEKGVPRSEVDINAWRMSDGKVFRIRDNQFQEIKGFNVYKKKR